MHGVCIQQIDNKYKIPICSLCGKTIDKELQKEAIREIIDGTSYTFDTNDCMLMFKKFGTVYEGNLFSE